MGRSLALSLTLMVIVTGVLEGLARQPALLPFLPFPSPAPNSLEAAQKIVLLDHYVESHGEPDCIILGSSPADLGIDPEAIEVGYHLMTGESVHCFNFSLADGSLSNLVDWGRYLIERLHPKLMILGVSIQDYCSGCSPHTHDLFQQLASNSYALRRFSTLTAWLNPDFHDFQETIQRSSTEIPISPSGRPVVTAGFWKADSPPNFRLQRETVLRSVLQHYQFDSGQLPVLGEVFGLESEGVSLIVAEMPVHPALVKYLPNQAADFVDYAQRVSAYAGRANVAYLQPDYTTLQLNDTDWFDPAHLNANGAQTYSLWLGKQITISAPFNHYVHKLPLPYINQSFIGQPGFGN
jgi:hypothetical protein